MNRYIRWILLNGAMIGTFLLGNILPHSGLLNVGLVLVYVSILMGVVSLIITMTLTNSAIDDTVRKQPDIVKKQVNRKIDIGFDVIMTGVLAFFGYPILAVFYVIHILGLHSLIVRVNESARRIEEREQ